MAHWGKTLICQKVHCAKNNKERMKNNKKFKTENDKMYSYYGIVPDRIPKYIHLRRKVNRYINEKIR